jgi:hypothetical protein
MPQAPADPAPVPRPAPPIGRAEGWLLLAPLLLLILAWPLAQRTDPDYWWHERTGQLIWEARALPNADPYSYTARGRPWVMHEWLSEVGLYLAESRAGYWANAVLFGLVGAGTALLVYRTCRAWGVGELPAAFLTVWAFALMAGSYNVRPQAFTAFFVALEVYLLTRYKAGARRALWALPPVFALWVNLHGGYAIGLAFLGLAVCGEAVAAWLGRPAAPVRPLLLALGLAALATLLNPYGVGALLYPLGYAGTGNASMRFIQEWQSPDFHQAGFATLALALAALMAVGVGRRPLGVSEALWALLTGLMSLLSVRHIQLFGIVALPLLGARLQEEAPALRRTLSAWRRPGVLGVLWLVVLAVPAALLASPQAGEVTLQFGRHPSARGYPAGAAEYLLRQRPAGQMLNLYGWGGYLIYTLYPDYPVFIDGRADVYGDAHMEVNQEIGRLAPGWREKMAAFDVGLVLTKKSAPLAVVLGEDPGWQVLYEGEEEALLARRSPEGGGQ